MSNSWLRLAGIFLPVFLIVLVLRLPAVWALHWVQGRIPVVIECVSVQGTLFNAKCQNMRLELTGGRTAYFNTFTWEVSPLVLPLGRIQVISSMAGYEGLLNGQVQITPGGWRLSVLDGDVSMGILNLIFPGLDLAGIQGRLSIRGRGVKFTGQGMLSSGELDIVINNFKSDLVDGVPPLGNYSIQLSFEPGTTTLGRIQTLTPDSPLQITGEISVRENDRKLIFTGKGRAGPGSTDSLHTFLSLMGEVKNGTVNIDWQADL